MEPLQTEPQRFEAIQLTAYYLWLERGAPIGTPEVDWFHAEEEVLGRREDPKTPVLLAVAATVGSALGSVAGIVASVGNLVSPVDIRSAK